MTLLAGRRVLVLGASGFIGRHVALRLAAEAADVVHTRRVGGPRLPPVGRVIEADLSFPGAAAELIKTLRPVVTFNLVGYGVDPDERDERLALWLNAGLVEEIVQAVLELPTVEEWTGCRLVHVGSAFEYGSVGGPIREDSACHPQSLYARSKLEGTRSVLAAVNTSHVRAVVARLATVYGSGEHPHRLLPSLLRLGASADATLPLTRGEQERDFTYVGDVADGLVRLVGAGEGSLGVINLATGILTPLRAFVETALDILGLPPDRVEIGALPYRSDEVWQGVLDLTRLQTATGWRPETGVREGIRRTIDAGGLRTREMAEG